MKLVVPNYDSGDPPHKVIAYYRGALLKRLRRGYGRSARMPHQKSPGYDFLFTAKTFNTPILGSPTLNVDGDNARQTSWKLKAGTAETNQPHVVSVAPAENRPKDRTFAPGLLCHHTPGKQGTSEGPLGRNFPNHADSKTSNPLILDVVRASW